MVVLKINADTPQEREVKIVNDEGTWQGGLYHVYTATSLQDIQIEEPHNTEGEDYLGELLIDKAKTSWEYRNVKLNLEEQKEIANFVIDYKAPDGVY